MLEFFCQQYQLQHKQNNTSKPDVKQDASANITKVEYKNTLYFSDVTTR